MITETCKCGHLVAWVKTQKGTNVLTDVVWEDGLKILRKNFQPVEHKCYEKKESGQVERQVGQRKSTR